MTSILDWLLGMEGVDLKSFAAWDVVLLNPLPAWFIFMILIPAIGYLCWRIYKREVGFLTKVKRFVLLGLRLAALLVLLLVFLEPVLSLERHHTRRGVVLVLVDQSMSMSVTDIQYTTAEREALAKIYRDGQGAAQPEHKMSELSRLEIVKGILRNKDLKFFETIQDKHDLKLYSFADGLKEHKFPTDKKKDPKAPVPSDAIKEGGDLTAMGSMIFEAVKDAKGAPIDAVVVFGDGRSNAGSPITSVAKSLFERVDAIPVFTIGVGVDKPPKDIRLVNMTAEPVVLINDDVTFSFDIEHNGFEGQKIEVQLSDGKRVVATQTVTLGPGGVRQTESLKIKAEKEGDFKYILNIPPQESELHKENNQQSQQVIVVNKKVKVLYVEGKPRWEYRYLKNALIRDDRLEAWCYLVESNPNFPQEMSLALMGKEQSLTRFPSELKELEKFDVIILGDVDLKALGEPKRPGDPVVDPHKIAENLSLFVSRLGGGIVFIGGADHNPYTYVNTPLENLLPIYVPALNPTQGRVFKEPFHARLSAHGKDDPLMRMVADPKANAEFWEDRDSRQESLPPFFWFVPLKEAKPHAKVLATHPSGSPLFVTMFYVSGQTMFLATDETWRWRSFVGDRYFYNFWGKVIHRMRQGKLTRNKRYSLFLHSQYALNEQVVVEARVLDEQLRPSTQESVTAEVVAPNQEKQSVKLELVPGKEGLYRGVYEPKKEGEYRITLGALGDPAQSSMETFAVTLQKLEYINTSMDRQAMMTLAAETGGAFYQLHDTPKLFEAMKKLKPHISYKEKREKKLWNTPLILLLFCTLIVTEWALRKKWGLA